MANDDIANFTSFGKTIFGIGKNYRTLAHDELIPTEPVIFFKPVSSYITEGQPIRILRGQKTLEHEVELGVVIGKKGFNISKENAMDHVAGYCIALDMTAKAYESEYAKANGFIPLAVSKGFDTACPVSKFIPKEKVEDVHHLDIWLEVNKDVRQYSNTRHMIYNIPSIVQCLSRYFTLHPGDLILTGTPEGVGEVKSGDVIECGVAGLMQMKFTVE